ncbi:amidohydrolase family protein [Anaerococcus sp. AGMB00486]|uniref:Amidohydrolase family protein n=2 Tax=Anaerococcus TaxID=165779 RepID=A0ABX2NC72_9FIRM|nr:MULTISPECIES: amidohydrolase family protein [Anaerococcus]MDY3007095.1 amidohydrolase family protein [Anaerococcus porci]MSS77960.1 amidohydrolase family protein [Anaerococcus porci]NVF12286.1 amidohydrolase family protein [Anaerococcus faecalis]
MNKFILKGNIIYSKNENEINFYEASYLVVKDGKSQGVYNRIPEEFINYEIIDFEDKIIMPGLVDLHIHAPQYNFRGMGLDLELLDWLNTYTFKAEAKFKDLSYAKRSYKRFVDYIRRGPNTRFAIFATLHLDPTIILMDMMEESGLVSFIGKVNMDRNGGAELEEKDADESIKTTISWLDKIKGKYKNTYPIITPRFIPSCSDELLNKLRKVKNEYKLPIQSHLSENLGEIDWVKDLVPKSDFYGEAYELFDLFGKENKTIMAHCVYSNDKEQKLMKDNGVFIAHCPDSNTNLTSGIAPAGKYLRNGQKIGLGSDIAGGVHSSIFKAMADAIKVSKLRYRLVDESIKPLSIEEAFYMATLGGGEFFGKVGSFEKDYEFDAIVIDDSYLLEEDELTLRQRLERIIYISEDRDVVSKFVRGERLF